MGATESVLNDRAETVTVWWQLVGGADANDQQELAPGATTEDHKTTLGLEHDVCVDYKTEDQRRTLCKRVHSPYVAGRHNTYTVSFIESKTPQEVMPIVPIIAVLSALVLLALLFFGIKSYRRSNAPK